MNLNRIIVILLGLICLILVLALSQQQTLCENQQENYCRSKCPMCIENLGHEYYDPIKGGWIIPNAIITEVQLNITER